MQIEKRFTFEAAHKLENPAWAEQKNREVFGKCFNLHGHSYKLYVAVSGPVSSETGMVMNFSDLKLYVQSMIVDYFDHSYLNELPEFAGLITSAENIITVIRQMLTQSWNFPQISLARIMLYETENSYAVWQKEQ